MRCGSNITFLLKDPTGKLNYEHIDSCREPIMEPHRFSFRPDPFHRLDAGGFESAFGRRSMSNAFSIKNNCRTPYCSKLVSHWSRNPSDDLSVLAYVMIDKRYFDPIIDSDFVGNYTRRVTSFEDFLFMDDA